MDPTRRAWVEVDLDAVRHNVGQLRHRLGPERRLMAVVKADAYGHGAIPVSRAALQAGATCLGVATLEEGVQLREAGIEAPIVVLGASVLPADLASLVRYAIEPTLCTPRQVLTCAEHLDRPHPVHLKIDTGMGRLGAPWQEAVAFVRLAYSQPNLTVASLYSHLATADEPGSRALVQQHQRFERLLTSLRALGIAPACVHLANSAATLGDRRLHYDMVRTGLALYGLVPGERFRGVLDLKPAMQVRARITQVRTVAAGTGVSYGHLWRTSRPSRLATVAIGYADGVPRTLSGRIGVLVGGVRVPQVGAITMDQLILDVTALDGVEEGQIVTLLGRDGERSIDIEEWAARLGTISYEIFCGFKHRLPRVVRQSSTVG
jgi:alanine racemase